MGENKLEVKDIFFECIKQEINLNSTTKKDSIISDEQIEKLFHLAKSHDLTHIVAKVLKTKNVLKDARLNKVYRDSLYLALHRYERKKYVVNQISQIFEQENIPYILLKGAVLCNYYPEAWMRTSCDIDILVQEQDLDKAIDLLKDKLGFTFGKKDSHDISLLSRGKVHVELHFDLIEVMPKVDNVLSGVWKTAELGTESKVQYFMPDEMFYFYHIAHMAKHFGHGGCGIRSFLDVWILNHNVSFDKNKRRELLAKGQLLTFAEMAETLSEVWFGDKEHNHITRLVEQYILEGGVYGNLENKVMMQRSQCENKFGYILRRIFMPYKEMKLEYPILKRNPFLLPIYWGVRWCKQLRSNKLKYFMKELQINNTATQNNQDRINELVKVLDLEI